MTTLTEAKRRVKRGAEYLDEVRPGWAHEIDIKTLEMANYSLCILGQLDLWDAFMYDHPGESKQHGFTGSIGDVTYDTLQYCWLTEISDRV